MNRQKVKLLLWFAALLSVLALVVVPTLAADVFTLTVEKAGEGAGTVTSDDGKINCGDDCEEVYEFASPPRLASNNVVTLTATPDQGSVFTGWGQNCQCGLNSPPSGAGLDPRTGPCPIIVTPRDVTCTANFGLPVGGIVVPVNKLGLLVPWLGLAALASFAALTVAMIRRRRG